MQSQDYLQAPVSRSVCLFACIRTILCYRRTKWIAWYNKIKKKYHAIFVNFHHKYSTQNLLNSDVIIYKFSNNQLIVVCKLHRLSCVYVQLIRCKSGWEWVSDTMKILLFLPLEHTNTWWEYINKNYNKKCIHVSNKWIERKDTK